MIDAPWFWDLIRKLGRFLEEIWNSPAITLEKKGIILLITSQRYQVTNIPSANFNQPEKNEQKNSQYSSKDFKIMIKRKSEWSSCNNQLFWLWEVSSWSESTQLLVRCVENSTWGEGLLWKRSPPASWFSRALFRDVPGTVPESVRTCGFKRKSSNLTRAPEMWHSVLLNSWDSFFSDPALNLLRNLRDVLLGNSRNGRVLRLAVPNDLMRFLWNNFQLSLVS